ncbi:hypothetical protein FV232_09510 [Methylobacterium sp. WL30]|uniref:hypothetical protein n=1 Tax=unclassified Methylobacterium TaxID=2615210 RepID=UPI0011CBDDBA|nr:MULTISPECIES: hypothetical protein [unclassified Methylobacterium]TXN41227.1 hypothetical protein FV225_03400 [Methylobacterium sp. WL93]TXN50639.1 hypothetical protein FV227_11270 [Methylobacterium sp. WL119]TXN68254.1 hypothetical protein FV232_09510 [Methylobacterium sp. WL30]TXN70158.1 hypothetical protein FV230_10945 [Methylobacterium sp. WL6]
MAPPPASASVSRRLQLTVPVAQQEFDRLGYFTDCLLAAGKNLTFDEAVSRLLMRPGTPMRSPGSFGEQPAVH